MYIFPYCKILYLGFFFFFEKWWIVSFWRAGASIRVELKHEFRHMRTIGRLIKLLALPTVQLNKPVSGCVNLVAPNYFPGAAEVHWLHCFLTRSQNVLNSLSKFSSVEQDGWVIALGIEQNNSAPSECWNYSSSLKQDIFQIKTQIK